MSIVNKLIHQFNAYYPTMKAITNKAIVFATPHVKTMGNKLGKTVVAATPQVKAMAGKLYEATPDMSAVTKYLPKSGRAGKLICCIETTRPKLMTVWRYVKVELKPPMPSEYETIKAGLRKIYSDAQTGKWKNVKNLTVKEVTLNTLVGLEIMFCFFIGEVIGRGSLIGYAVPGAVYYGPDM